VLRAKFRAGVFDDEANTFPLLAVRPFQPIDSAF
jgi:hypothetical protein